MVEFLPNMSKGFTSVCSSEKKNGMAAIVFALFHFSLVKETDWLKKTDSVAWHKWWHLLETPIVRRVTS